MAIEVKHTTQAVGTDAGNGEIAKAQWNEAHTINMATGTLLGRSTAGTGAAEEIAIGSGLSLSAGTLSASGGGGGALTISNKTAAYTVVAGDLGKIINCTSGTFTVSLTAAATLGAGFNCWVWNTSSTSTNVVTIDPSGAETIDGVATLMIRRGEGLQIVCNGTNWQTGDKKTMRGYAENLTSTHARPTASGDGAIAIGSSAVASGGGSLALGGSSIFTGVSTASGSGSLAIQGGTAGGNYSTAIGVNGSSNTGSVTATTGSGAMALGGSYASGTDSFAAAVANNTSSYGATGANSIALGQTAAASGTNAVAIGRNAVASGTYAIALSTDADGVTASGTRSVAIGGSFVSATGDRSIALGSYADAATKGKLAFSSVHVTGSDATTDAQYGLFTLATATTNTTPKAIATDAGTAGSVNQVILANNTAYVFTGTVVAKQSGSTNAAAWNIEGMIVRGANAASTTLVASVTTPISNLPLWAVALSADTTNGGLAVTVTGAAATNIKWVSTIQTSEVTYA